MKKPEYIYYTKVYEYDKLVDARVAFHPHQFHRLNRVYTRFGNRGIGRSVSCDRYSFDEDKWEPYLGE